MAEDILRRNNVTTQGSGTTSMIFAHGFGCDQNMWRFVAPAFEDDYQTVLFDYVGSGQSDLSAYNPIRYGDLNGYAQDVLEICESLGLQDTIFVGHSVGAMIGILASIQRPEFFSQLILIGPSPRYMNDLPDYIGGFERSDLDGLFDLMDKNYLSWAGYLAPAIMGNLERPGLAAELETSFCKVNPAIARQFAEVTFYGDNREDLPKVTTPALILQSTDDIIAPLEVGAYVYHHIPESTLQIMEATGHCPHMSHPEETIRLIQEYLASRGSVPTRPLEQGRI
ncbi:alpha/beta hydrolase [Paenibacillus sp. YPG26]|uniref:alpha/beta fold hydrolase n=1 Tax=Paenibacillus sp. YPG26 TaxID=2878915 RepID=UPI00203D4678|nr:alpha/beta hydrolase [Paenibacillus sp. YPG26]USB32993.1 alpha/beta hydrolase [Paenibacillus sp. YPG26]